MPDTAQLVLQDPTWDAARWGGHGNFWYHHVYMPAQNPGDPSGMSAYGRWMYGPWFWPPATPPYGPIPNPYYGKDPATNFTTDLAVPCNLDVPATWQYETDPFCEPQLIPGTPNISAGMEQFNDTPLVNGTAYPTLTVEPKTYRLRVLNAANDRFWNLQWYIADPPTGTESEVALNPAELAAAQTDLNVFPDARTPVFSPPGPSWIQIGSEGGFLPAPVVVPNQPTTWITDPTRFDVGNVDKHSLLLAPAERADVIVDFSEYAGQDADPLQRRARRLPGPRPQLRLLHRGAGHEPERRADHPARLRSQHPYRHAGHGRATPPGRRLQPDPAQERVQAQCERHRCVRVRPAPDHRRAGGLQLRVRHELRREQLLQRRQHHHPLRRVRPHLGSGQHPVRVQHAPGTQRKMQIKLEPKGMHDEMNSAAFDEFGRMTANLGLENVPATPGLQNITLYPYINPPTEIFNATNLPSASVEVTPIASATDGTQIWKITHNGVDTHPIHFHLYDVQVLNRVAWDNNIIPPDATELGWKDTVRISPLEDTIVAMRPVVPDLPWELPNAIRYLNPATEAGSTMGFNPITPAGQDVPITNQLVNFGWEYVWHCHILSHEEMDMMRPQSLAVPPSVPTGLSYSLDAVGHVVLNWTDNSIAETSYQVQRSADGTLWTDVGTPIQSPLDQANGTGPRTLTDPSAISGSFYRVIANNTVGLGGGVWERHGPVGI